MMRARSLQAERWASVLSEEVRESVLSFRLGLEYEPLVDVHTGETFGHEALSRFRTADGAILPPARVFGELAREPALLAQVELDVKRLQIDRAPRGTVFLNVDAEGFAHEATRGDNRLLELLAAGGGRDLVVEVVETCHATAAGRARDMVRELRAAGVAVALDDVGATGALLSLDVLRGADVVKFDRAVLERPGDPRERASARGLVAVARALGARTVLEGVERADQLRLAEEMGFDLVQGFLLRDRCVSVAPAL